MNSWEQTDPPAGLSRGAAVAGPAATPGHGFSGRWVVLAMFAFGISATALLWLYWELHTQPFRALQQAIVHEFPGSNPRVQGGQKKMHKHTPRVLQIVMRVDFDPVAGEAESNQVAERIAELARRNHDVATYDVIEIGLFLLRAEEDPRMRTIRFPTHPAGP
jgi:hypothetical protein